MSARRFGRTTLREQMQSARRGLDHYAILTGKPKLSHPPLPPEPKRRAPMGASGRPLEGPVKVAVGQLLATHPLVAFAVRQNSGAVYVEGNYPQARKSFPIWFYKIVRSDLDVTITDYWGFMRGPGHGPFEFMPFALECKRPGWKFANKPLEVQQEKFLLTIRELGGRAGFCTAADEAQRIIEGK